ncbi:MAG: hypothetical protein E7278_10385 [Lachnospiraceae bacterium]|nr:hypothetical protein [Lachnospiraceae bacterium]
MNKELEALILRKNALEAELSRIIKEQKKEPEGSLQVRGGRKNYRYFHITSKDSKITRVYIRKKNHSLAKLLALKRYNKVRKAEILAELKCLSDLISKREKQTVTSYELIHDLPGYRELLSPVFYPYYEKNEVWKNEEYEKNNNYPDSLRYKTKNNLMVRSKSEVFIVNALLEHNIPFRYECALPLGDITFYPDFTIYLAKQDREIIWEHFGLMDNPDYRENMYSKMRRYMMHGYMPGHSMICTYESNDYPLTEDYIEKMIATYLL